VTLLVSANYLEGKKVVGLNGDAIGEVKDVEFDLTNWKVTNLQLKLSDKAASELGLQTTSGSLGPFSMTHGTKTVFMPIELVSAVSDVITVNKSLLEITQSHLLKRYAE
jgi:sporulation protein YlmC with PRC-barrel domain